MRNQGTLVVALIVIALGVVLLINSLFEINLWVFCFPAGLILLGLWILFSPGLSSRDKPTSLRLLGDIKRRGQWQVTDEQVLVGVGDVRLDMTEADIPVGATTIRVWMFVGDVRVEVPDGVGVELASVAFLTDARFLGRKREAFLTPIEFTSDDYAASERVVRVETTGFVVDVRIQRK